MNYRNLYRVWLRGSIAGPYYVVAETTDEAVNEVVGDMNRRDYGFSRDRVLDKVELLAQQYEYTAAPRLFVAPCPPSRDEYGDGK
jgi:hypothetical protein